MQLSKEKITKRLEPFSDEELEMMKTAVEKTRQQYVDNELLDYCPLCIFNRKHRGNSCHCKKCPHILFNKISCIDWLDKNSSLSLFHQEMPLEVGSLLLLDCRYKQVPAYR